MSPKDAEGMANSVDPDQTAPLGAVWSGSALFAQTCLSENLGSLRVLQYTVMILDRRVWANSADQDQTAFEATFDLHQLYALLVKLIEPLSHAKNCFDIS